MKTQLYCKYYHSFLADRLVEGKCLTCGYVDVRGDQCNLYGELPETLKLKNHDVKYFIPLHLYSPTPLSLRYASQSLKYYASGADLGI